MPLFALLLALATSSAQLKDFASTARQLSARAGDQDEVDALIDRSVRELRELQADPALAERLDRAHAEEALADLRDAAARDDTESVRRAARGLAAALSDAAAGRSGSATSGLYQVDALLRQARREGPRRALPLTREAQGLWRELALAPSISGSPTAAQIGGELSAVSEALKSGNGELLGRSLGSALQLLDELDGEVTRRRKLPPPRLSAPPLAAESGPPSAAPSPVPAAIAPPPPPPAPQQPGQQPQFQTVPLPGQAAPIAEPAPGR